MFRAMLPSIFITSRKVPRLPRTLHLVICWSSPGNAIPRKHATRHVQSAAPLATQNEDGHVQDAAHATKNATPLLQRSQKYSACHTKRLSTRYQTHPHVTKCKACHAKQGYATLEPFKHDALCRRETTTRHTGGEHRSNPQTNYKREPFATCTQPGKGTQNLR